VSEHVAYNGLMLISNQKAEAVHVAADIMLDHASQLTSGQSIS